MGCADYRIDCNGDSDGDRGGDLQHIADEATESCRNAQILGTDSWTSQAAKPSEHGFK